MVETARSLTTLGCDRKFMRQASWLKSALALLEEPFFNVFTATISLASGSLSFKPAARPGKKQKQNNNQNNSCVVVMINYSYHEF